MEKGETADELQITPVQMHSQDDSNEFDYIDVDKINEMGGSGEFDMKVKANTGSGPVKA